MTFDISHSLISVPIIEQRIASLFPDSIVLDSQFRFVTLSKNIQDALGFSREDLYQKSVSMVSKMGDFESQLKGMLRTGYFADELIEIRKKDGESIAYIASGFYLGLISDANGLIILKLKNQDEINLRYTEIQNKTQEIDRFVYQSAHSLRGPLATVKGLINLGKAYRKSPELEFIFEQLDTYSEKLDDKLHQLVYFAESDKSEVNTSQQVPLSTMVELIEELVAGTNSKHPVHFECVAENKALGFENGELILASIRNLVKFFCQQENAAENSLKFDAHASETAFEFVLQAVGFYPTELLNSKLSALHFSYSEILRHPELIHYYTCKKVVFKLRGEMQFIVSGNGVLTVLITVPRDREQVSIPLQNRKGEFNRRNVAGY